MSAPTLSSGNGEVPSVPTERTRGVRLSARNSRASFGGAMIVVFQPGACGPPDDLSISPLTAYCSLSQSLAKLCIYYRVQGGVCQERY